VIGKVSPEMTRMAMDVAMTNKHKELIEQHGEAAVDLIESSQVDQQREIAALKGVGTLVDVYI
jgi:hypothetical protein